MKRIGRDHCIFSMSRDNAPVLSVDSGEVVVFETRDCYNNQIRTEDQAFTPSAGEFNNPATGPLEVVGAEIGDILKIEVLDIKVGPTGVMAVRPKAGVLGDVFTDARTRVINIDQGMAIFNDRVSLPIDPMIGVIGVSPAESSLKTTVPYTHGGNLDCKRIVKGSVVYLPVMVAGAMLSIGDLHAVMADGEIVICALEVEGEVAVRVTVIKGRRLLMPFVVQGDQVMALASAETLDEAARQATMDMHDFLVNEVSIPTHEAGMLLSLVGDLCICQIVDPLMTARMEFPLSILHAYGYTLP